MPRTAALLSNVIFDKDDEPDRMRISSTSNPHRVSTISELSDTKTGDAINIIHDANMDGVRHLKDDNRCIRYTWAAVIITFVFFALIQIFWQIEFYYRNPIATNIEAEYPRKIAFPTVAVCNNNQFRLTYITGAWLLNRGIKLKDEPVNSTLSVFDRVLLNAWEMDAVKFLRKAAHTKSRMILGCTWPNGTACRLSDFRPVWTMTGLCWAINSDEHNPFEVSGAGSGHGLRLLLNVESYERIEACSEHFRTNRLPGVKILIYNQTDVPETSLSGVNVPAGFSMDIPFKMQHRHKLAVSSCIVEGEVEKEAASNFSSPHNIRTCAIKKYLRQIAKVCGCSFSRAFDNKEENKSGLPYCTVGDYFKCVAEAVERVRESGAAAGCLPPCESIEFTAWQDMNRLPHNMMPPLIEELEEEDEDDVENEESDLFMLSETHNDHFTCRGQNRYLDDKQVSRIKREAHRAYEKQSRFQEDVRERTKRIIARLRRSMQKLSELRWGWRSDELNTPYERLVNASQCFAKLTKGERMTSRVSRSSTEEIRTQQIHSLIDEPSFHRQPDRFKTLGGLKEYYGSRVEELLHESNTLTSAMENLWSIFDPQTYTTTVSADLQRMDRILELVEQYEAGGLQRRVWAEKMESRQMKHFFEEEFMDGWSAPISRDLDQIVLKTIHDIETHEWPLVQKSIASGHAGKIGAVIFFGESGPAKAQEFEKLLEEMYECATGEVKEESKKLLQEFKKGMRELQSAYNNLFKKELPDYLELYDFGSKFETENFALVNIFMHQMHLEHWRQYETYSFWSLACDVGGALGLFVGASLLTLIEIIYLCFKYGVCSRRRPHKVLKWVRAASVKRRNFSPTDRKRRRPSLEPLEDSPEWEEERERRGAVPEWRSPVKNTFDTIPEETSTATDPVNRTEITPSESVSQAQPLFSPTQGKQTSL